MTLSAKPKNPIFGLGQAFNGGVVGDATIEFVSSGLVGTAYGLPGFSATLVATGLYELRYPKTAVRGARFYPHVMPPVPSGTATPGAFPSNTVAQYQANMSNVSGQSGVAYLQITSPFQGASSAAGGFASGLKPANPPTGAIVNLQVLGSPISRY